MQRSLLGFVLFSLAFGVGCSSDPAEETGGSGAGGEGPAGSGGQAATGGQATGSGGASGGSLCEAGCVLTLAADCENGPASEAVCVADCEELLAGSCGSEYGAFQTCADGESVECGESGIPVVPSCSAEQTTFIDCLNAP